jgi:hypothetical protein
MIINESMYKELYNRDASIILKPKIYSKSELNIHPFLVRLTEAIFGNNVGWSNKPSSINSLIQYSNYADNAKNIKELDYKSNSLRILDKIVTIFKLDNCNYLGEFGFNFEYFDDHINIFIDESEINDSKEGLENYLVLINNLIEKNIAKSFDLEKYNNSFNDESVILVTANYTPQKIITYKNRIFTLWYYLLLYSNLIKLLGVNFIKEKILDNTFPFPVCMPNETLIKIIDFIVYYNLDNQININEFDNNKKFYDLLDLIGGEILDKELTSLVHLST